MSHTQYLHPYPKGATWEFVDPITKMEGMVWLERIEQYHEMWMYSWSYRDGSAPLSASDWTTSKKSAVSACKSSMRVHGAKTKYKDIRFKRTK